MYCIIEAMIGVDSGVQLLEPVADGVPDMVRQILIMYWMDVRLEHSICMPHAKVGV